MNRSCQLFLIFILQLCAVCLYAQNNSFSENPVAIRYQLKQEGLKGKVKKITLKDSTGKVISQEGYDTKGRITRKLVGSDRYAILDNFSYDSVNKSIVQKTEYATGEKVFFKYAHNSNGDITNYYIGSQDGTIFYSKRLYHYQDNLFITDSAWNPGASDSYTIHQYNNKGQIINSKTYTQKAKVLIEENSYEYKMQDGLPLIKIITKTDYSGGGRFENSTSIKYFDNNQNLIKVQNPGSTAYSVKPRELTYKLDATGNWISNSKRETREIDYYETPPATNKQVSVPANNNTQLTLLLDEDFENNNNKWTVWDNEASAAQIVNGNYRITIKRSDNFASWLSFPALASDQSKDFAIETKIFLNTTETGTPNDSYWLLWGLGIDGKNFYSFGIYPDGKFQYGKSDNGAWDAKAGSIYSSSINAGINKANVLRVEKKKNDIFFFVNGKEVHKAKYEAFNINNAGVGFQWNNKKTLDIDYLKIFRGSAASSVLSPEPYESNYQKALVNAANTKQRGTALNNYYNSIRTLNLSEGDLKFLLEQKLLQMIEIDFYVLYDFRLDQLPAKGNTDIKPYLLIEGVYRKVLSDEQYKTLSFYTEYMMGEKEIQVYNQTTGQTSTTPKIAWKSNAPRPGYGWGKTISSDKTTATTANTVNKPAVTNPAPVDELTQLKDAMNYVKGRWVYLSKQQKHFYVPKNYTVTSLTDQIMLKEILASSTYDSYKARNVFSVRYSDGSTYTLPVTELVKALYTNTNSYIVTSIYQCSGCLGRGGTWNNNTRLGATCKSCGGSGCVSSQSGGGYSNMPYVNFIY